MFLCIYNQWFCCIKTLYTNPIKIKQIVNNFIENDRIHIKQSLCTERKESCFENNMKKQILYLFFTVSSVFIGGSKIAFDANAIKNEEHNFYS